MFTQAFRSTLVRDDDHVLDVSCSTFKVTATLPVARLKSRTVETKYGPKAFKLQPIFGNSFSFHFRCESPPPVIVATLSTRCCGGRHAEECTSLGARLNCMSTPPGGGLTSSFDGQRSKRFSRSKRLPDSTWLGRVFFNPFLLQQTSAMSSVQVAIPGQVLGNTETHRPGEGTHVFEGKIYASIAGEAVVTTATATTTTTTTTGQTPTPASTTGGASTKSGAAKAGPKPTISVARRGPAQGPARSIPYPPWSSAGAGGAAGAGGSRLPVVGGVVLCRVVRVQQRQANVLIIGIVDCGESGSGSGNARASASTSSLVYTTSISEDRQFGATLRREDVRAYEKDTVVMDASFRVGDVVRAIVVSLGDERNYYVSTAGNDFGVVVATSEQGNSMVPVSWREMRDVVTGKTEPRKVAKPTV